MARSGRAGRNASACEPSGVNRLTAGESVDWVCRMAHFVRNPAYQRNPAYGFGRH